MILVVEPNDSFAPGQLEEKEVWAVFSNVVILQSSYFENRMNEFGDIGLI